MAPKRSASGGADTATAGTGSSPPSELRVVLVKESPKYRAADVCAEYAITCAPDMPAFRFSGREWFIIALEADGVRVPFAPGEAVSMQIFDDRDPEAGSSCMATKTNKSPWKESGLHFFNAVEWCVVGEYRISFWLHPESIRKSGGWADAVAAGTCKLRDLDFTGILVTDVAWEAHVALAVAKQLEADLAQAEAAKRAAGGGYPLAPLTPREEAWLLSQRADRGGDVRQDPPPAVLADLATRMAQELRTRGCKHVSLLAPYFESEIARAKRLDIERRQREVQKRRTLVEAAAAKAAAGGVRAVAAAGGKLGLLSSSATLASLATGSGGAAAASSSSSSSARPLGLTIDTSYGGATSSSAVGGGQAASKGSRGGGAAAAGVASSSPAADSLPVDAAAGSAVPGMLPLLRSRFLPFEALLEQWQKEEAAAAEAVKQASGGGGGEGSSSSSDAIDIDAASQCSPASAAFSPQEFDAIIDALSPKTNDAARAGRRKTRSSGSGSSRPGLRYDPGSTPMDWAAGARFAVQAIAELTQPARVAVAEALRRAALAARTVSSGGVSPLPATALGSLAIPAFAGLDWTTLDGARAAIAAVQAADAAAAPAAQGRGRKRGAGVAAAAAPPPAAAAPPPAKRRKLAPAAAAPDAEDPIVVLGGSRGAGASSSSSQLAALPLRALPGYGYCARILGDLPHTYEMEFATSRPWK